MNRKFKALIVLAIGSIVILIVAMGIGSVSISPLDTASIILKKLFGGSGLTVTRATDEVILWDIRIPRTLLAFVSGSGLALSGVIMQSVLKNPLASSFTLGVSSGSALGASFVILLQISWFGMFTLPIFGLSAGLLTVIFALTLTKKIDRHMQNNSIILTGMAFSLFASALITIIIAFSHEQLRQLIFWQMGSFSLKSVSELFVLTPIVGSGFLILFGCVRQMDILSLGDEQAQTSGVDVVKVKWFLLVIGAVLTGAVVSLVGIIGFVDLFTPHIARKLFGAAHKFVLPASALLGGSFMVVSDLIARTMFSPLELPVGAITSVMGAPFFIYIYFSQRKKLQ